MPTATTRKRPAPSASPKKAAAAAQRRPAANAPVRLGIIGVGGMGGYHANYLREGKVSRVVIAAIADRNPAKLEKYKGWQGVELFRDGADLIAKAQVDAVLVATPHYDHTTLGIAALNRGLHLLVEKPISVHRADCERLIAAHEAHPELVFAAMFNQRTIKAHIRMKELVAKGELGEIRRINWIVTDWFRTDSYYASGGWRATWAGEGGGVLLNQCPHNLDLLQWITGMMPNQVRAFCNFGKRHEIEVEDEVTAYLEYPNGATGVFITTTGEAPGTNRLEIVGERGKLIFEGQENLKFVRNEVPMGEFCRTAAGGFDKPETWNVEIHADRSGPQHQGITQNFVDAILDGTPLIARAEEGIRSVEIANAMLLSTFLDRTVTLPIDGALYEKELKKRFQTGAAKKKKVVKASESSMASTF